LYRLEEGARVQPGGVESAGAVRAGFIRETLGVGPIVGPLALWRLRNRGDISAGDGSYRLTGTGRERAKALVRGHRLWESYMAKHFDVPADHLHEAAERVEHYIGPALREDLEAELDRPGRDPHGRKIPAGE
jgi:Mn-dependent DtxR family transcriptional regulator